MPTSGASQRVPLQRALVFGLFLVGGWLLFFLGNNWNALFPTNRSTLYKWGLTVLFLALAVGLRLSARGRPYWRIALALCVAAFANALNWGLGDWLGRWLRPAGRAQLIAFDKLSQSVPVVLSIVLLTLLSGGDLGSLFLKKGDWREALRFGGISFAIFAVLFVVIAIVQAGAPSGAGLTASGMPLAAIVADLPWILVFIAANAIMEELWFRGLFLGRLSPLLGAWPAVLVTALVFASIHFGATYITPFQRILFTAVALGLGVVNGRVMLKTGSIWGSVLFHAGYDLMIIIPILASVG